MSTKAHEGNQRSFVTRHNFQKPSCDLQGAFTVISVPVQDRQSRIGRSLLGPQGGSPIDPVFSLGLIAEIEIIKTDPTQAER